MIVIDTKQKMKDALFRGAELLRYQGKIELASEFEKWVPPRFPVTGNDLKQEGVPGKLVKSCQCDLLNFSLSKFRGEIHEYGNSTIT